MQWTIAHFVNEINYTTVFLLNMQLYHLEVTTLPWVIYVPHFCLNTHVLAVKYQG